MRSMGLIVPPKWKVEPTDQSAVVGDRVTFDCSADGFPTPVIRWKISTGLYDITESRKLQCVWEEIRRIRENKKGKRSQASESKCRASHREFYWQISFSAGVFHTHWVRLWETDTHFSLAFFSSSFFDRIFLSPFFASMIFPFRSVIYHSISVFSLSAITSDLLPVNFLLVPTSVPIPYVSFCPKRLHVWATISLSHILAALFFPS